MTKECNVVRDLIPIYAEDLASEESADFVTNHCNQCDECRKQLEYALNPIKCEEEQVDENMKKVFANLDKIQKKHIRKRICIISVCVVFVFAISTYLYSFVFHGNTWFTKVEYSDSYLFVPDENPGAYSLTNTTRSDMKKSAEEVKSFFRKHFDGCVLFKLVLDEEKTTAEKIIFNSEFYVLHDSLVFNSGDTHTYSWELEYNHLTDEWMLKNYGYG